MDNEHRRFIECFETSNEIRACHKLWEDFTKDRPEIRGRKLYKIAFYVSLEKNEHNAKRGKDNKGNYGFGLKYVE